MSHFYGDQYGSQRYGGFADSLISQYSPNTFSNDGGHIITVFGEFTINGIYAAFIGTNKNSTDAPCYSGVSGNGFDIISEDGVQIQLVVPAVTKGNQYITLSGPGIAEFLFVTVIEKDWFTKTHRTRRSLSRWWAIGNRTLSLEKRI